MLWNLPLDAEVNPWRKYLSLVEPGAMAERLKALVLKTSDTERYRGFESLSLRSPALEKYPSGRRGSPAKGVVRVTAARVQIPASPLFCSVPQPYPNGQKNMLSAEKR